MDAKHAKRAETLKNRIAVVKITQRFMKDDYKALDAFFATWDDMDGENETPETKLIRMSMSKLSAAIGYLDCVLELTPEDTV